MKVPGSVRRVYEQRLPDLQRLKQRTDEVLRPIADRREGLYLSRIKELKSIEQALETGRWAAFEEVPDLFAATIVVGRKSELSDLEEELVETFTLKDRRPPRGGTFAAPECFAYDDVRLYVRHRQAPGLPVDERLSRNFELQIKTFLQHAWARATHEPVYKGEIVSWMRARIAAQARAALEQTELAVEAVDTLAGKFGDPEYPKYSEMKQIADALFARWEDERLPPNRRRFVECVRDLLTHLKLSVGDLTEMLTSEENDDIFRSLNVSPFQAVLVGMFRRRRDAFQRLSGKKFRLMITPELVDLEPLIADLPISGNVQVA